jgi:signal transduction histidine kinase
MHNRIVFLLLLLCLALPSSAQLSFMDNFIERSMPETVTDEALTRMETELRQIEKIKSRYPDSALALCRKVFNDSRRMKFPDGMATSLLWTGSVYLSDKGQPLEALKYYRMAEQHCRQAVNVRTSLLILWHNDMAAAFSVQGQYDSALVYYYKGLTTALQHKDSDIKDMAMMNNNMASIYYVLEQYNEARPYLAKAEHISDSAGYKNLLIDAYNNYTSIFIVQDKLDSADIYLRKMRALQAWATPGQAGAIDYLQGMLLLKKKEYRQAIPSFLAAQEQTPSNTRDRVNNLSGLGLAYLFTSRYREAIRYMEESIDLSLQAGISGRSLVESYGNLAEVYDSARNYKQAYYFRSLASNLRDSLNKMENIKNLNTFETRYLTAEKNKEIAKKKLQLAIAETSLRKKDLWIAIIIGGAVILLILVAWLSQKQRLQLQKAKTARQQLQVQQLKAVIEGEEKERSRIGRQLHDDIMVQLSIVKMGMEALPMEYPRIKSAEGYINIVQQLTHASQQLRQTAHNLMPDALLEEGLVSAVLYFCRSVEKLTGIRFLFQHYGEIPAVSSDIEVSIYRIIQELVQNIIKHSGAANALVQLNYRKGILSITVEDDGKGIREGDLAENKMGLKSIRNRLKTLDGTIDIHHCTPHGTSVNIELSI